MSKDTPTPARPALDASELAPALDDQIQYRTMVLRGTGNPITADLIDRLARDRSDMRAACEAARVELSEERRWVTCNQRILAALRVIDEALARSAP